MFNFTQHLKKSIFIFRDWISSLSFSQVIFSLLAPILVISHCASSKCEWQVAFQILFSLDLDYYLLLIHCIHPQRYTLQNNQEQYKKSNTKYH